MQNLLMMLCSLELGAFEVIMDRHCPEAERDFQYHWRKMTGKDAVLKVEKHPYTVTKKSFFQESFRLKSVKGEGKVYISGEGPVGVSHGLYEVLQRLGCDWIMPGELGEVIPKVDKPELGDLDIEQAPAFDYRNPWYPGSRRPGNAKYTADYNLWKQRHKLSRPDAVHPLRNCGGHKWQEFIRRYQKEFDANPEMYALVRPLDGPPVRKGPQIETTDPKLLDLYEKHIREMFKKNNWSNDKLVGIGVGPADGGGASQSAESLAAASGQLNPLSGSPELIDIMILFCNQLLARLEKDYPNLYLGFYLYSWHADYPVRYPIHPKIVIVIADIGYSRMHSTLDKVPSRVYYRTIMEKWANTPNVKFFRGYNWNLAENILPFSKLKIWEDDLPLYHRMGIRGVDNESINGWATVAPSNYYEAKMLWDVTLKAKPVLHHFCVSAFGKAAAEPMEKYYWMQTERQCSAKQEAGSFHSFGLIYDFAFLDEADKLFAEARRLAETDVQRRRIDMLYIPVRQLRLFLTLREKMHSFQFAEAEKLFYQIQKERKEKMQEIQYSISGGAVTYFDRFFKNPVTTAAKYSTEPYRIVFKVPDRLPFAFDPTNRGEVLGFADPEIDDSNWLTMKTYTSTWAAQGLIGLSGSTWYRVRVPRIEGNAGLLIGGADRQVKIYCNGKFVGTDVGFSKAMLFDLTGHLDKETNLLAIQVRRKGSSELGTGGLIYPSYIFTGPRLTKEEGTPQGEQFRLLPGGAIEKIKK